MSKKRGKNYIIIYKHLPERREMFMAMSKIFNVDYTQRSRDVALRMENTPQRAIEIRIMFLCVNVLNCSHGLKEFGGDLHLIFPPKQL